MGGGRPQVRARGVIAADLLIPTQLAISPPRFLDSDLELAVAGRHQALWRQAMTRSSLRRRTWTTLLEEALPGETLRVSSNPQMFSILPKRTAFTFSKRILREEQLLERYSRTTSIGSARNGTRSSSRTCTTSVSQSSISAHWLRG